MFSAYMAFIALLTATARDKTQPSGNFLKVPSFLKDLTGSVFIRSEHNFSTFTKSRKTTSSQDQDSYCSQIKK